VKDARPVPSHLSAQKPGGAVEEVEAEVDEAGAIGSPSTMTWHSGRCQARGRTTMVAVALVQTILDIETGWVRSAVRPLEECTDPLRQVARLFTAFISLSTLKNLEQRGADLDRRAAGGWPIEG
jgi:hypothetical protein